MSYTTDFPLTDEQLAACKPIPHPCYRCRLYQRAEDAEDLAALEAGKADPGVLLDVLDPDDFDELLRMMAEPQEPAPSLRRAVERYQQMVVQDEETQDGQTNDA